jgi:hypothetical protein
METYEFKHWGEFRSWIDRNRQPIPVYWRGQKDPSWSLASHFERIILKLAGGGADGAAQIYPYDNRYQRNGQKIWTDDFYQAMRDTYLREFKVAAAGLRGANPACLNTDQWWSLGRHFGLVTPLLDWTESPYIAAFFALSELLTEMRQSGARDRSGKKIGEALIFSGKKVAVYRLFHNSELEELKGDGLRVVRPIVDELGRMHGQRGLFTWLDSEKYFELQGFLDDKRCGKLLTQLVISDQAVIDGLSDLWAHGIDYRLLFPDLEGAAKSVNMNLTMPKSPPVGPIPSGNPSASIFDASFQPPENLEDL